MSSNSRPGTYSWCDSSVNPYAVAIATVAPISEAGEITALVERLRGAFPTANHHGYAYRLGRDRDRFSLTRAGPAIKFARVSFIGRRTEKACDVPHL